MSRVSRYSFAVVALAAVVAVWLHWPSLHAGLAADDYLQRGMLDGEYPVARSPLDLYSFLRKPGELRPVMEGGIAPWWSHPELRLSLLRPVSSALLFLDHRVLGLSPFGQHVHSMSWLVAFVVAYHLFARALLSEGAALIATAVMAFDSALVAPVAWLCNRTSLVSATFGALGLWAYLRDRKEGWRWGAPLAGTAFALALGAGEYAFCALAYVAAYELFAAEDAPRRRASRALLAVVPAALYLALHFGLGYGAQGSVVYVGPFDSPLEFASGALLRVPSLVATELLLVPGEWFYAALLAKNAFALAALAPIALFTGMTVVLATKGDRATRGAILTCALGALLGLLPLAGTIPSVRLILIPSFGGSALVGALVWHGVERLRARRSAWSFAWVALSMPFAALHLGLAPKHTRDHAVAWTAIVSAIRNKHLGAEIDDARVGEQELYLVNAAGDIGALIYPPWVRHQRGAPMPKRWLALSISLRPERALRVADDTLELSVDEGTLFEDPTSQLFRAPTLPFRVGERVALPGVVISVEEVRGWAPTRVRFRFDGSLDDPRRVFLLMEAGRIRRAIMPPVGESFVVTPHG